MDSAVDNKPGRCKVIISLLALHYILPVPITESGETVVLGAGGWQMLQVVHQPCGQIREQENGFIYEPKELLGLPDEKGDSWAAEAQGPQQQMPQWSRPTCLTGLQPPNRGLVPRMACQSHDTEILIPGGSPLPSGSSSLDSALQLRGTSKRNSLGVLQCWQPREAGKRPPKL